MYYKIKRKEIAQDIIQSVNYKPTRIRKTLKNILKESIPISLSSLMSSFNKNIDLFTVVKKLKNVMSENLAKTQYGILSGKVDTLCVLPLSLNIPLVTAMVPNISQTMAKGEKKLLSKKISMFIQTTFLIAMPATVGMWIFSEPILILLFPNASDGATLLKINSISIIFTMLSQTINAALQGIGKNNVPMIAFTVGIVCKFLSNSILVGNENIGINGAAIGNIICNFVVCLIGFIVLKRNVKINLNKFIFRIFIATFIMAVLSIYIYNFLKSIISIKMATILVIAIAMGVYLGIAMLLGLFKNVKK